MGLVHSDVCGPMLTASYGGAKYFVTFIDDYSRICRVYFMRTKDEVLSKFMEYEAEVANQTDKRIKVLRTDNGGEYTSKQFEDYLKMKGIMHQKTVPHSPQQNGVAERLNRTINEIALAQIVHANVPRNLWAESAGAAVYIRNCMPMTTIDCDPVPTPVQQSSSSTLEQVESQSQQSADNFEPAPATRMSLRKRKGSE